MEFSKIASSIILFLFLDLFSIASVNGKPCNGICMSRWTACMTQCSSESECTGCNRSLSSCRLKKCGSAASRRSSVPGSKSKFMKNIFNAVANKNDAQSKVMKKLQRKWKLFFRLRRKLFF